MAASTEQLTYVPVTGAADPEPAPAEPSRPSRGRFGGALGALTLLVAAVLALSALSMCGGGGAVIAAAPEALSEQKGARGGGGGSWFQTSCLATKACKCPGQVCYRKNKFWAMCMESCDKDVPEVDDKGKKHYWNCSELGPRTPAAPADGKCSGGNEDCRSSRCCQGRGLQCYAKNEYWATCKASCKKGVDPKDADGSPWSCEELGPRTPGSPFGQTPGTQDVPQCAWDKGNCLASKCCRVQGSTCYKKDDTWATCEKSCAKKPAMGGPWTCEAIGGAPRLPEPLAPTPGQGTALSLFCFTVVMPTTFEVGLVGTQREKKVGIFECDASAVFQGARAPEGKSIKLVAIPKVFQSIWEEVQKDGHYLRHDWTVKADPDVVFLPDRLKEHLQKLNAPPTPGIYVKNTHAGYGFNGAVQVYSKGAMRKYFMHHKECSKNMVTQAEDVYMMTCLDAAGVRYMRDGMMLNDQTTFQFASDMKDLSYCADVRFAAYHPYKDVDRWMQCRDRSIKAVKKCPAIGR